MVLLLGYFGGALVSFTTVVVWRGRRGANCLGRSRCRCGRPLTWYENIPIIGWASNRLQGGAKCCGSLVPHFIAGTELIGWIGWSVFGYFVTIYLLGEASLIALLTGLLSALFSVVLATFIVYKLDIKNDPQPEPMKEGEYS